MVRFAILIINNQINKMSINVQGNIPKSRFRNFFESLDEWFEYKDKSKWIEDMRSSISVTASLIATVTFSVSTNPPGGVVQAGPDNAGLRDDHNKHCKTENGTRLCLAEAVLGSIDIGGYFPFLVCNTICFIASLSVIFLLVSGIPMDNTFTIWLLSSCMSFTHIPCFYLHVCCNQWSHQIPFGVLMIMCLPLVLLFGLP
jgi:hypothetical protein